MSSDRTYRLVSLINMQCRRPLGAAKPHDIFGLTVVAGVVSFLEDSGMPEAADAVETLLVTDMIPRAAKG